MRIPYSEMDANIVALAKAINTFDGIYTISSCGGHAKNKKYQLSADKWEVTFQLEAARQNSPSVRAWLVLEFLVYAFSKCFTSDKGDVRITTFSPSPYLNGLGHSISFTVEGSGVNPDDVAEWLLEFKKECFD
ncbi:MAG: hypothetical protein IPL32_09310 [Chloracidobacterium sp.]|nr:hypothetical protein [Chloracidobacterium sp.]